MTEYIHLPNINRRHKNITATDLIMVRLVRGAMAPDWAPGPAATELVETNASAHLLRCCRAKLLRALEVHNTRPGQRALTVLTLAIHLVETPPEHRGSAPKVPRPRTA